MTSINIIQHIHDTIHNILQRYLPYDGIEEKILMSEPEEIIKFLEYANSDKISSHEKILLPMNVYLFISCNSQKVCEYIVNNRELDDDTPLDEYKEENNDIPKWKLDLMDKWTTIEESVSDLDSSVAKKSVHTK